MVKIENEKVFNLREMGEKIRDRFELKHYARRINVSILWIRVFFLGVSKAFSIKGEFKLLLCERGFHFGFFSLVYCCDLFLGKKCCGLCHFLCHLSVILCGKEVHGCVTQIDGVWGGDLDCVWVLGGELD